MIAEAVTVDADEIAGRADRLLSLWSALSVQHVALGSSCACGTGGVSLRIDDFEIDIVDYLEDAGSRSGIADVVAFFEERQQPDLLLRIEQMVAIAASLLGQIHGLIGVTDQCFGIGIVMGEKRRPDAG